MSAALRRLDPSRSSALTPGHILFVLTAVASLFILFLPESGVPTAPSGTDKVIHFALFAALAGTGQLAGFRTSHLLSGLVAYAVLSEVAQGLLPLGRSAEYIDALADWAGMLTGWAVVRWGARAWRTRPRQRTNQRT